MKPYKLAANAEYNTYYDTTYSTANAILRATSIDTVWTRTETLRSTIENVNTSYSNTSHLTNKTVPTSHWTTIQTTYQTVYPYANYPAGYYGCGSGGSYYHVGGYIGGNIATCKNTSWHTVSGQANTMIRTYYSTEFRSYYFTWTSLGNTDRYRSTQVNTVDRYSYRQTSHQTWRTTAW